jgi:hypothetical protein
VQFETVPVAARRAVGTSSIGIRLEGGYGEGWRMRDFEQTGTGNSRMLTSSRDPQEK